MFDIIWGCRSGSQTIIVAAGKEIGPNQIKLSLGTHRLTQSLTMDVDILRKISVVNLKNICRPHMRLTHCQTRASLYSAISGQSTAVQETINTQAGRAIRNGLTKYGRESREGRDGQGPSKRRKVNEEPAEICDANGGDCVMCIEGYVNQMQY